MRNLILGLFLGLLFMLVANSPKYTLEKRLQDKIQALEWLIVDHEREINTIKKKDIKCLQ